MITKNFDLTKDIFVVHHNDLDGFGGAYAAWKKLGNKAVYIPQNHGTDIFQFPFNEVKNKKIYFIDFVFSMEQIKQLLEQNNDITILDHHASSEKVVKSVQDYVYSEKNSGAVIAWRYFHPTKAMPKVFKYIEDMDYYWFKLAKTREVTSFLKCFEFDFKVWDKLIKDTQNVAKFNRLLDIGKMIMKYEQRKVGIINTEAVLVNFCGREILAVNSPYLTDQLARNLYNIKPPMSLIWYQMNDGGIKVSLRASHKYDINVASLAEKFGGGGHEKAAGFFVKAGEKVPWEIISK